MWKKEYSVLMKMSMDEHREQVGFFQMARVFYDRFPELSALLYAIPNGGDRKIGTGSRLRAEGVRPGIPDICCALPFCGYHALYIEMKREKGGTVSADQETVMGWLAKAGYLAVVARGRNEAFGVLEMYLEGKVGSGITERMEASSILGRR